MCVMVAGAVVGPKASVGMAESGRVHDHSLGVSNSSLANRWTVREADANTGRYQALRIFVQS
jgi:hypothetical protein